MDLISRNRSRVFLFERQRSRPSEELTYLSRNDLDSKRQLMRGSTSFWCPCEDHYMGTTARWTRRLVRAQAHRHLSVTNTFRIGSRSGHAILVCARCDWSLRLLADGRSNPKVAYLPANVTIIPNASLSRSLIESQLPFSAK